MSFNTLSPELIALADTIMGQRQAERMERMEIDDDDVSEEGAAVPSSANVYPPLPARATGGILHGLSPILPLQMFPGNYHLPSAPVPAPHQTVAHQHNETTHSGLLPLPGASATVFGIGHIVRGHTLMGVFDDDDVSTTMDEEEEYPRWMNDDAAEEYIMEVSENSPYGVLTDIVMGNIVMGNNLNRVDVRS